MSTARSPRSEGHTGARSIAWLNRNHRLSKDFEYRVQSSETMLAIAAIRLMLNRLTPA
jgi:putative transposase